MSHIPQEKHLRIIKRGRRPRPPVMAQLVRAQMCVCSVYKADHIAYLLPFYVVCVACVTPTPTGASVTCRLFRKGAMQLVLCPPPAGLHHQLHQIRRHHQVRASLLLSPRRRCLDLCPPRQPFLFFKIKDIIILPQTPSAAEEPDTSCPCVPMAKASAGSSSSPWH